MFVVVVERNERMVTYPYVFPEIFVPEYVACTGTITLDRVELPTTPYVSENIYIPTGMENVIFSLIMVS